MTGKIAILIISGLDQRAKVMSGLHVAKRIYDARGENGIEKVEVFLFTGGIRALETIGFCIHENSEFKSGN